MSAASADDEDATTLVFAAGRGDRRAPTSRSGLWNPAGRGRVFLQVSQSWVYQKAEAGLIPVIRLPAAHSSVRAGTMRQSPRRVGSGKGPDGSRRRTSE